MMRSTNNIGGDSGEKSSVKVAYAPGGKSNFSLGWGMDEAPEPKPVGSRKMYGNQNQQTSNIFGGEPEKPSIKVNQKPGGNSNISLGSDTNNYFGDSKKKEEAYYKPDDSNKYSQNKRSEPVSDNSVHTSVKVKNPPGGKSNFTLG